MKKLITVAVPVYNELLNIQPLYMRTSAVCETLSAYDYEIVFFDDGSTDGTRKEIEALCAADTHVKAVFYSRNFGYSKNIFYAMQQAKGDCAIILHADLQNPPELIPAFIEKWETGAQIVQGVKTKSKENGLMFFLRTVYYWLMRVVFGVKLKPHARPPNKRKNEVQCQQVLRFCHGGHSGVLAVSSAADHGTLRRTVVGACRRNDCVLCETRGGDVRG